MPNYINLEEIDISEQIDKKTNKIYEEVLKLGYKGDNVLMYDLIFSGVSCVFRFVASCEECNKTWECDAWENFWAIINEPYFKLRHWLTPLYYYTCTQNATNEEIKEAIIQRKKILRRNYGN